MLDSKIKTKCPMDLFIEVLGSKWNILIIWKLKNGTLRFSDLQKTMNNVNSNTLTAHLRELEDLKIISRIVFPEVPPRVEYSLTEHGTALFPIFDAMRAWGLHYIEREGMKAKKC
jgi:DNA-binding HxlR family transcriptional regulator